MFHLVRLVLLISCICTYSLCIGQNDCQCKEADTLRQSIGKYYNSGKLDSAAFVLNKLQASKNKACQIVYLDGLGQIAIAKKDFPQARQYFLLEEQLQKQLNCKKLLIRYYNTLARYYQETGYRDSVSSFTLNALLLAEEEKEWYAAARASINLASLFQQEKQLNAYLNYSKKALFFARKAKDSIILAAVLTRAAESYYEMFREKSSKEYLDTCYSLATECLSISRNKPANLLELVDAYCKISQYHIAVKEYTNAIAYADSTIKLCPKGVFDFYRHLLNGYSAKSEIFYELKNYQEARLMADSAYHYAQLFNKQLAIQPLDIIVRSSKALKDFERATLAHEEMIHLRDSIYTIEKTATINELEKKYNQAKNEKTIQELSLQKKIYLLLSIVALLIVGVIIVLLRQQSLQQQQKILETEQRLNRARMNPHFLFNALTSIQSLLLQKRDQITIVSNLAKFAHLMRNILESTYHDYIPIEQEIDFLKKYLDVQLMRFPEKFSYSLHIDDKLDLQAWKLPSMIIQPFVENSIEHGFKNIDYPGLIEIHFNKQNSELHIQIIDNGSGLHQENDQTDTHISRATQILKDRLYLLNTSLKSKAKFTILAGKQSGIEVSIHLPRILND